MAFSDYKSLKNKLAAPLDRIYHIKNSSLPAWMSQLVSSWAFGGSVTGTNPPVGPNTAPAGSVNLPFNNTLSLGYNSYFSNFILQSTTPSRVSVDSIQFGFLSGIDLNLASGYVMLVDRINHSGGLDGNTTSLQLVNTPPLPRYSDGKGIWAAIQIWADVGTGGSTATVNYTNTQGVSKTAVAPIGYTYTNTNSSIGVGLSFPVLSTAGTLIPIPVTSGDVGVLSVQSAQLNTPTGVTGNWGIVMFKTLAIIPWTTIDAIVTSGNLLPMFGQLPIVDPNSHLELLIAGTAFTNTSSGVTSNTLMPVTFLSKTITLVDDTAPNPSPVLTSPALVGTGDTTATASVATDTANGTLFWAVTGRATALAPWQIAGSQDEFGKATITSGYQRVTASGAQSISVTGLVPGIQQYIYYNHVNTDGCQSTVISANVTTSTTFDMNFVADTAFSGGSSQVLANLMTGYATPVGGGQALWTPDNTGVFSSIIPRTSNLGMLLEGSRTNACLQARDLSITNHVVLVTDISSSLIDGETINATGGGAGVYVAADSNRLSNLFAVRNGSGTFSGTLTGATSGASSVITSSTAIWTGTNVTIALNQFGADGATTVCSATATAGNATVLQSIPAGASSRRVGSMYLKRLVGTGTVQITIDGGTTWTTAAVTSNYTLFQTPIQTSTAPVIGIRLVTNGDSVAVDFAQEEALPTANDFFASYPNTTKPLPRTKPADGISILQGSPFGITTGTFFIEWGPLEEPTAGATPVLLSIGFDTSNYFQIGLDAANHVQFTSVVGGVTLATLTTVGAVGAGQVYRTAFAFALNDQAFTTSFTQTIFQAATALPIGGSSAGVALGADPALANNFKGFIRHIMWNPNRLPNSILLGWTNS